MADVSQQRINTLTQTASQTPQFQASSDPVQGVLSAAQLGLDFYAKQQAQEQLTQLEAQQSRQQTTLAEGALGLRNLRQQLASQGASSVKIQKAEKEYLSRYDSSTAFEIVGATNKVSGRNLATTVDESESVAKARVDKEQEAARLSGFLNKLPPVNGTEEELDAYILQGVAEQSYYSGISARAAAESALATNAEQKRGIQMRAAGGMLNRFVGANASKLVSEALSMTDLSDVTSKKNMLQLLTAEKAKIPEMVRNFYANQNLNATSVEVQQKVDELTQSVDVALNFLSGDAAAKINKNALTNVMNNVLFEALGSDNPDSRAAASGIAVALGTGTPVQPSHIQNLQLAGMRQVLAGESYRAVNDALVQTGQAQYDAARAMIPGMLKSQEPDVANTNYEMLVNNFTGSPEKLNSSEGKKNIAKMLEGIAGAGQQVNIPEEKKAVVGSMIKQVVEPKLQATFSAFMTEHKWPSIGMEGRSGSTSVTARGADAYSFNPDTLEVRPIAPDQQMSTRAVALNKLVRDTIKTYEALGIDVEPLKDNIRNTFGIDTGEGNGEEKL